ncbi:hypothetical protein P3W85_20005 [Cupriavidus basilensis]|uniref:Uncharacterized protein n=1 Tax=Cupriavidus basilensis TaxID=68895 RepID=A0ABT6AS66_9BURK|nr:hypothetical protein [Cupriavidus basilensis]MDF3835228.1 hypothetical protein [Cupriavidus basilensis]
MVKVIRQPDFAQRTQAIGTEPLGSSSGEIMSPLMRVFSHVMSQNRYNHSHM